MRFLIFILDKAVIKRYNICCDNWGEPMVLNLKGLLNGDGKAIEVNTVLDFTNEEFSGEKPFAKPVSVIGKVLNKAGVTELSLECNVTVKKPCDRCGVETVKEYTVPVNRILVTELVEEDNIDLLLVSDYELDLYEVCLGEILLALPMKHLCSEECKGICSICGKNLNEGSCGCKTKSVDPRLEVLLKLLEDED